ncbi:hypothetical protein PN36_20640 [Candidatus Thiomargarita nelsonii]|uniref:Gingipain domain-containing protein n=1 Tax=Candidatus Thiomargarita nelsonii TaxID=1003181 RepID=A0A0A6P6X5_9GAMM|nr:hypothetical protein PN36_20640 [Candidatus Thiomargarita nelsonii]
MNYLKHYLFWFIGTLLCLSHAESLADITLLESSAQSLTLELTIPEPAHSEKNIRGTLIAIPDDSQLQLEILDSDTEILSGILPPLNSDNAQPTSPVKIGMIGYLREQRVAQIQFFPVQHNPVQQTIKLYKRLRVKVSFSNDTRTANAPVVEDSPQFDKMLQRLLINDATSNRVLRRTRTVRDTTCPSPLPALKISIDKTGVYAISYADFLALGLDLSVLDARQIHMSHQGEPVSIFIAGEEDGVFGAGDVLYFYAQAVDGLYTRNNVYWLSLNPNGGARLNFKEGTPAPNLPQYPSFTQTLHVENNNLYWSRMPDSTNRDHLFWEMTGAGNSLDMPITLHHLAQTSGNATIRVMLQGKTDNRAIAADHHTKILLNGVEIHDAYWDGQEVFLQEVSLPQAQLFEGANTVTLVSVGDTGATANIIYVNWLEIDYTATTTAVQDHLIFDATGSGQYNLTVNGFTQPDLLVLDVTDPLQIVPLLGATVSDSQIQYADQLNGGKTYYAFSFAKRLKPAAISIDLPSIRLKSPCNRADYFIIYHDSFDINALQGVVAARGVQVMAVPVSDIYDEFNHGLPDPQAIKDFLTYAYENYTAPRPAYVLLVGDANRDTLNDLGHGINYIPTYTFHTSEMGETPTDNWFVSIIGDDPLPDMFLGRIPIRTQAELDAVVNKLIRYPQVPLDGWQRQVLFVADDDARSFKAVSERLIEQHLADYIPKRVYLGEYADVEAVTQDIIQSINAGAVVTNYTGHGSLNLWTKKDIFNFGDVALLNNPDKLTFVVALNCQNGLFSYSQPFRGTTDSLAEAFLKAESKGAIAMFAPGGLGYTSEHQVLSNELFQRLFQDNVTELGSLTTLAKIAAVSNYGISRDSLEMFTLFGDPGLRLRLE